MTGEKSCFYLTAVSDGLKRPKSTSRFFLTFINHLTSACHPIYAIACLTTTNNAYHAIDLMVVLGHEIVLIFTAVFGKQGI